MILKGWDDQEDEDEERARARPAAKDYFGHDLPWALGTCADTYRSTRTPNLWPVCYDKKGSKRVVQAREPEATCKEVLQRQLKNAKSLLDVIGKPMQKENPQKQRHESGFGEEERKGSIVFIKTHKTATEYGSDMFIITPLCVGH